LSLVLSDYLICCINLQLLEGKIILQLCIIIEGTIN